MRARARRAFTLIETAIVIIIIAMLVSIVLVAVTHALRTARAAGERQLVHSLKMAVDQFKSDFDFYPPLMDDVLGPVNAQNDPVVKADDFLRADPGMTPGARYSEFSLAYYVVGAADKAVDGVDGPGYTTPLRPKGGPPPTAPFTRRGPAHPALLDVAKTNNRLHRDATTPTKITIWDRWDQPIRYYRWLPTYDANGNVLAYNVPPEVGDPATKPELRAAQYAIVSLGSDPLDDKDNIVEVGP